MKRSLVCVLALGCLSACVRVEYARPGGVLEPRADRVLVVGRLRFEHDQSEFYPWRPSWPYPGSERHLWLLRLDRRAVSAELHPDPDGSLALWLEPGDYALLGSTESDIAPPVAPEVVALMRVPKGAVASYAGELVSSTESHEGGHLGSGEFGSKRVQTESLPTARAVIEQRFGSLQGPLVSSPWCAGTDVPHFDDADLALRARALLDRACPAAR